MVDYYEFLQISPHADTETIHRVYRFLASRFHPDNPQSGDANLFHLVKSAYDVLSDPKHRAEYDASCRRGSVEREPLSSTVDFMDSLEGELNRRLALLAVLYHRRRTTQDTPEVTLDAIEERMGFPRDYLDFTIWYLLKKGYITRADNAEHTITADGVDFVEARRGTVPILNKMLTVDSFSPAAPAEGTSKVKRSPDVVRVSGPATPAKAAKTPIILPSEFEGIQDRRKILPDRRQDRPDRRQNLPDRRINKVDRRVNPERRRSTN
jgi:hypothetical protein